MLFNSLPFLFVFLPLALAVFFAFSALRWRDAAALWLGLASLAFYGQSDPRYLLPIILSSIAFNFIAGNILARYPNRIFLAVAVAANLLLLGYYKYADFFAGTISTITGIALAQPNVALPIGISFFTFTQIAFLVDTFSGKASEYKPHHYLLFVTFFPHLIAGPILHHKEMMPQFQARETYRFNPKFFALGLTWFTAGLFKKVVLADSLIEIVGRVFAPGAALHGMTLADSWAGTLAYGLQIYFDFSGYSDMAIGLSLLFGIVLPLNFNSPYKAVSLVDFWRRWHMTLSRFLRDYLYIPLGGNRKGRFRRYANLLVTMLLGGLWHGAAWNFVLWGGLHGAGLAVNHLWHDQSTRLGLRLPATAARILTFLLVLWAWVPFRAGSFADTLSIWRVMTHVEGLHSLTLNLADQQTVAWAGLLLMIAVGAPNTQTLFGRGIASMSADPAPFYWRLNWKWGLGMGSAFGVAFAFMLGHQVTQFLYFRF